jgi:hypothetical protein
MNSLEQIIQTKNNKNRIMRMIENTHWCGRNQKDNIFIFWIENDCKQFQIIFCEDCGNYIYRCENETLLCNCSI